MSDSTSTISLTSEFPSDSDDLTADQLTDGLDLSFDGAEDILRSWRKGMRPDPDQDVRAFLHRIDEGEVGKRIRHAP